MSIVAKLMLNSEKELLEANHVTNYMLDTLSLESILSMSRFQYLSILTELATELNRLTEGSIDEIFSELARIPREKLKTEVVSRLQKR